MRYHGTYYRKTEPGKSNLTGRFIMGMAIARIEADQKRRIEILGEEEARRETSMSDNRRSGSRDRRRSRSHSKDHQEQRSPSKKDREPPKGEKKKDSSRASSRSVDSSADQEPRAAWEREHSPPRSATSSHPTEEDWGRSVHRTFHGARTPAEIHGVMDSRLSAKGKAQQEEVRSRKRTSQGSGYSTPQVSSRDTSRDTQQERPREE